MTNRMITYFLSLILLAANAGSCITYSGNQDAIHLELPATDATERIIRYVDNSDGSEKLSYTVSYDIRNKQPRWVAYDLTSAELEGTASRKGKNFRPDEHAGVPQADNYDYRNSGWTKGHLAPAGDFKWSDKAMGDTFFYTNCCPQTEYFNGTSWERLESRVRSWAKKFGTVYIVTGPIIGQVSNGYLGSNMIPIPDAFFKAVLAKDGDSYQAIGFIMENSSQQQPYTSCCVTIDEIERITGLDLYCSLDDATERDVESSYNTHFWGF